nr:MAG TPA: hypothetical protein [Caudoviricetes sp.]
MLIVACLRHREGFLRALIALAVLTYWQRV